MFLFYLHAHLLHIYVYIYVVVILNGSRDSSISIAKDYGIDDRGSIPGKGKIFFSCKDFRPALGPTRPLNQCVQGVLSLGW
jgi:hypothetical protein